MNTTCHFKCLLNIINALSSPPRFASAANSMDVADGLHQIPPANANSSNGFMMTILPQQTTPLLKDQQETTMQQRLRLKTDNAMHPLLQIEPLLSRTLARW